jgi:hypothetical protein
MTKIPLKNLNIARMNLNDEKPAKKFEEVEVGAKGTRAIVTQKYSPIRPRAKL